MHTITYASGGLLRMRDPLPLPLDSKYHKFCFLIIKQSRVYKISVRFDLQKFHSLPFRDRAIFIGTMGPVQNAMGRTLFLFVFKHGADTFFLHLQPWGRYFFQSLFTHGKDTFSPLILKTHIKLVYMIVRNCSPSAII